MTAPPLLYACRYCARTTPQRPVLSEARPGTFLPSCCVVCATSRPRVWAHAPLACATPAQLGAMVAFDDPASGSAFLPELGAGANLERVMAVLARVDVGEG